MSDHPGFSLHYPGTTMRAPTLPSQSRPLSTRSYFSSPMSLDRSAHPQQLCSMPQEYAQLDLTEDQDSGNSKTMLSEPVHPALEGFPDVHAFDNLMDRYVKELSPKKQDKALIHAARAANIKTVLLDKKTTQIESAQFR
ncbi:hypothetical protein PV10_04122 [Exophiala mesophila]|uniref:Uncharacterized protein n=1 Tax=Exophiala mesophila TaxID=212818 RepID=A0A0D2A1C9_EXOME|nr:uncharacterized protein PV10_04122 [Exophiala mesophila]KIV92858.1 hypothetical protein PV10_04122 [Exophiala mesophila]